MIRIVISILGLIVAYFFYRPFIKTKAGRNMVIKLNVGLLILSTLFYALVMYLDSKTEVGSFTEGITLLKADPSIAKKIGRFESYTYDQGRLPNVKDNPAHFEVAMEGDLATIFLSCEVKKDSLGRWEMVSVRQDSIKNK